MIFPYEFVKCLYPSVYVYIYNIQLNLLIVSTLNIFIILSIGITIKYYIFVEYIQSNKKH